jgi:putative hemolysin
MDTLIVIGIVISFFTTCFFAGIEVGFITLNRITVELRKKQKSQAASDLSRYLDEPARFIGAMIAGLVIFLSVYGLLVDELLSKAWLILGRFVPQQLEPLLKLIRILFDLIVSAAVLLISYFFFRSVFRSKADTLMFFLNPVIKFSFNLLDPLARRLVLLSEWILQNLLSVKIKQNKRNYNRLENDYFLQQRGKMETAHQDVNKDLFEAALTMPYLRVRQCLVPRKEIEAIASQESIESLKKRFMDTNLSRLIVYDENIDHITGYVHQLSLFKHPQSIQSAMLPITAVPESMSAAELMNRFIRERKSIAWVVDEFGGTAGIITMEDLLEELFGEIKDEYDVEELIEREIAEGVYEFSGRIEMDLLHSKYKMDIQNDGIETLSGYIIHHHEGIPKLQEHIIIGVYEFEIIEVNDTTIRLVRVRKAI